MKRAASNFHRQHGAVLYIALIMLILLALLGITGMQVSMLQERMASNYFATNAAFQNTEATARGTERDIQDGVTGGAGTFYATNENCATDWDPASWAHKQSTVDAGSRVYTRRIDRCFPSSSIRVDAKLNEQTGNIYEVSAFDRDRPENPSAEASVNTVFIP